MLHGHPVPPQAPRNTHRSKGFRNTSEPTPYSILSQPILFHVEVLSQSHDMDVTVLNDRAPLFEKHNLL